MSYGLLERPFPKESTICLTCHSGEPANGRPEPSEGASEESAKRPERSEGSPISLYRMSDGPTVRATARPFASLRLPAFLSGAWWPVAQGDKGVNDLSLPFVIGPEGFLRTFEMQDSIIQRLEGQR